jgi:hypothetical protein
VAGFTTTDTDPPSLSYEHPSTASPLLRAHWETLVISPPPLPDTPKLLPLRECQGTHVRLEADLCLAPQASEAGPPSTSGSSGSTPMIAAPHDWIRPSNALRPEWWVSGFPTRTWLQRRRCRSRAAPSLRDGVGQETRYCALCDPIMGPEEPSLEPPLRWRRRPAIHGSP